ncbi:MAG: RsmB/NOP family class I SAM-dependent RNA methyltransferase [Promethearchaeota archaeon]|jgi:NOL1/NOP2/sun family putative RNA methylase
MIERYLQFLGIDDTIKLLKANERPLTPSIRVNTIKIKTKELQERLEQKGFELESINWVSYAFKILKETYNIGSLHEYLQGYFYLQNIASMLPAIILNPKASDIVVEMCAAPGGKATHLSQLMNNKGNLILIEKNKNRIPALEVNLRKLGVTNSIVLNFDAINITNLKIKADKILLDAPCTGEGLIRQDESRKKSKKLRDIEKMSLIQKKLLKSGLETLSPDGELLYSTCSIAPEENELVVHDVLEQRDDAEIIKASESYGVEGLTEVYGKTLIDNLKYAQRLYPHVHDTIGFFMCLIKKINK